MVYQQAPGTRDTAPMSQAQRNHGCSKAPGPRGTKDTKGILGTRVTKFNVTFGTRDTETKTPTTPQAPGTPSYDQQFGQQGHQRYHRQQRQLPMTQRLPQAPEMSPASESLMTLSAPGTPTMYQGHFWLQGHGTQLPEIPLQSLELRQLIAAGTNKALMLGTTQKQDSQFTQNTFRDSYNGETTDETYGVIMRQVAS